MKNMLKRKDIDNNLGLCTNRQVNAAFKHIMCTENIADNCLLSTETRERAYVFPLFILTTPEDTAGTLFAQSETTRKANLSPAFIAALSEKLGLAYVEDKNPHPASPKSKKPDLEEVPAGQKGSFGPEDVFYYAYAVFHSPTYRSRYAEFLKIDFPRLPLTSDVNMFFALAERGRQLVALHLLKNPLVEEFITSYPAGGDNRVEKVVFAPDPKKPSVGQVMINARQYFGGVPSEVWNFKIGGYQVCDKWLKDRKGRVLSNDDINHYQRVVVALQGTIRLMAEIDALIPAWPME